MIAIQRRAVVDEYKQFSFARNSVAFGSNGRLYYPHQARFETISGRTGVLVEEGTTNLLSAADSQGFTSPVNVTVTNGTIYTVSMTGTGSITLSGAGTGTVTASSPVTFTANGTTLTLTPNGDTGRVQVEAKPYKTTWQIGGTTRAAETLTVPTAGVLDPQEGTVEAWVYIPSPQGGPQERSSSRYVFACSPGSGSGLSYPNTLAIRHDGTAGWAAWSVDGSGNASFASVGISNDLPAGWHLVTMRWSGAELSLWFDGVKKASATNPYLPTDLPSTLAIGHWSGGSLYANTLIGPLRISRRARTDQEIADAYAAGTLTADADTTLLLPFTGPDAQRGARVLYVPAVGF